jgi:hypothetical protein
VGNKSSTLTESEYFGMTVMVQNNIHEEVIEDSVWEMLADYH